MIGGEKPEVVGGNEGTEGLAGDQSAVAGPVGKSPEEAAVIVKDLFAEWKSGDGIAPEINESVPEGLNPSDIENSQPADPEHKEEVGPDGIPGITITIGETKYPEKKPRQLSEIDLPPAEIIKTKDGGSFSIREYPIPAEDFVQEHGTVAYCVPDVKKLETLDHAEIGYDGLWVHFDSGDTTPNPKDFSTREYFETKLKPVLDNIKESDPDLYDELKKKQLDVHRFQTPTALSLSIEEDGLHRGIQTGAIPSSDERSPGIVLTNNDSNSTIAHEMGHAVFPKLPLRELSEMTAIGLGMDYYAGDPILDDSESDVNPKKLVANRSVGNTFAPVLAVLSDNHQPLPQTVEELVRVAKEVGHPLSSIIEPEYNYASGYFLALTENGRDRDAAKRVALASVEVRKELGSATVPTAEIMRKSIMKGLDMTEDEARKVMERAAEIVMFRRQTLVGSPDAPLLGPAFDEQVQKNRDEEAQDAADRARLIL